MAANQVVPIIALLPEGDMLQDIHGHMINTLKSTYIVKIVTGKQEAEQMLQHLAVKLVVANDKDVAPLIKKSGFLERGGTVIFAGLFSSTTNMPDFCKCFKSLGLPWTNGEYYRSDFFPTQAAESHFRGIPSSYNAKALLAAGVAPADRVYTPTSQSKTQSLVFASQAVSSSGQEEAAVALGKAGNGWVGYIGDVNGEEQTSHILLAMLNFAAAQ